MSRGPWKYGQLTRDLIERMAEVVRDGAYFKDAAHSVGVNPSTLSNWLSEGRRHAHEIDEGKLDETTLNVTQKMRLDCYRSMSGARSSATVKIVRKIVESEDPNVLLKFLRYTQPKYYSGNYVIDEVTNKTEEKPDAATLVAERLAQLLEDG